MWWAGGNIDGPSAGVAIFAAIYSALTQIPLRPTVALTGELSLSGRIKPVGGIPEKIFGARQQGLTTVLIPKDNEGDVPPGIGDMKIIFVGTVEEVLPEVLA